MSGQRERGDAAIPGRRSRAAITAFVVVAFGFSWLVWLPLVFAGPTTVMPWYFYLGSLGPALGAIAASVVLRPYRSVGAEELWMAASILS